MFTVPLSLLVVDQSSRVICPGLLFQTASSCMPPSLCLSGDPFSTSSLDDLFLLHCGFHVRVCLVRWCWLPEHVTNPPHRLLVVSSPAVSWCVLSHKSMLLMVSGRRICRILLRQLLITVVQCTCVRKSLSVLVHLSNAMDSHHFFISVVVHSNRRIEISHEDGHILFSALVQDAL